MLWSFSLTIFSRNHDCISFTWCSEMAGQTCLQQQNNRGKQTDSHLNYVTKKLHSLEKPRLMSCGKVPLIQVSKNLTFKARCGSFLSSFHVVPEVTSLRWAACLQRNIFCNRLIIKRLCWNEKQPITNTMHNASTTFFFKKNPTVLLDILKPKEPTLYRRDAKNLSWGCTWISAG